MTKADPVPLSEITRSDSRYAIDTLRRKVQRRELPHVRVGRRIFIERSVLAELERGVRFPALQRKGPTAESSLDGSPSASASLSQGDALDLLEERARTLAEESAGSPRELVTELLLRLDAATETRAWSDESDRRRA